MYILIWTQHPGDILGEAINFLTHGNAQHAGFLRKNGLIHEAYYPKVRDRKMSPLEKQYIRCFHLKNVTDVQQDKFERIFDINLKAQIEYSISDLFRFQFNVKFPDEMHTICSRYDYHTISQVDTSLLPLVRCEDDQVSPRDLLISPNLEEIDINTVFIQN